MKNNISKRKYIYCIYWGKNPHINAKAAIMDESEILTTVARGPVGGWVNSQREAEKNTQENK